MRLLLIPLAIAIAGDAPAALHAQRGTVTEFQVKSPTLGVDRRVWVYTPAGYRPNDGNTYDLVLAFDGADYQKDMPLPAILDSLIARKHLRATVALLVDNGDGVARIADLGNAPRFVTFIGSELMPWFRARYPNVSRDPAHAIVTGSSAGGLGAMYIALERPDLFGNVLAQSAALWRGANASNGAPFEWLTSHYEAAPAKHLRFFIDVGDQETRGALGGAAPSILAANRHMVRVLRAKKYDLTYTEVAGGVHAPQTWAPRLPIGLVTLAGTP